jgi:nitrogen fixation/metabolism regulation signal transduction histidine kinase
MRFSIRNKLLAGFGAVIAVLAILGVMALSQMGSINAGATSFNDDVVPSITVVDTASQDAEAVRSTQYQHVLAPDEATMNALQQRLAADTATVDGAVKRYRADMVSDAHDRAMIDAVAGAWRDYESATARVVTLSRTGHDQQATAILNGAAPAYQRLETALQRLVAGNRAAGQQVHRDSNSTFATAKTLTITLILLALAIGAAVAFALSRSISRGIGQMLRAARGLAEGDIEQDVQVSSRALPAHRLSCRTGPSSLRHVRGGGGLGSPTFCGRAGRPSRSAHRGANIGARRLRAA